MGTDRLTPTIARRRGIPSANVVKSAGRVLQILEFFDSVQRAASVTEVREALRYPQSSTSVLMRSMVVMGYLSYDRRRRTYVPTRRVAMMGGWLEKTASPCREIVRLIDQLSSSIDATVAVTARNDLDAQVVYVRQAHPRHAPLMVGDKRSLTRCSSGRVLLGNCGDLEVRQVLHRSNAERQAEFPPQRFPDLKSSLLEDARRGYCCMPSICGDGLATLAMPIDLGLYDRHAIAIVAKRDKVYPNAHRFAAMAHQMMSTLLERPAQTQLAYAPVRSA